MLPKPTIVTRVEPAPNPEPKPAAEVETKPKAVEPPQRSQPESVENPQQKASLNKAKKQSPTPPVPVQFDPYTAIDSVISQQSQVYFDDLPITSLQQYNQNQPGNKSINSINSIAEPQMKALFKSTISVDSHTRVINYGGVCKQIDRIHTDNGDVEYRWSNTSLDCGVGNADKLQLQRSLNKFITPKKLGSK